MTWLRLANKTAIVTGAASGIGRAVAQALADAGCSRLVLADRQSSPPPQGFSAETTFVECDVSVRAQVEELMHVASNNTKLAASILVNCAGITRDGFVDKMTEDDWNQVLDVNLKGTFYCCQSFLKAAPNGSSIVNVGSIVSEQGNIGQVNYAASKGGVVGLTRALAKEMAARRQIRVNAVLPGFIETPMSQAVPPHILTNIQKKIALQRFGTPEEVADVISFLVSDRSNYITGETIECSGMISL